jgi:hypothetical protein
VFHELISSYQINPSDIQSGMCAVKIFVITKSAKKSAQEELHDFSAVSGIIGFIKLMFRLVGRVVITKRRAVFAKQ